MIPPCAPKEIGIAKPRWSVGFHTVRERLDIKIDTSPWCPRFGVIRGGDSWPSKYMSIKIAQTITPS